MNRVPALHVAMDLMHSPSQAPRIRAAPLPDGVVMLLRVAAGDAQATKQATALIGRSHQVVREAAAFFIEQILLYPDADSYRVLAAAPETTHAELRRNMALLLRWLHPDLDGQNERSVFAARVTRAWNDLKTQERRAAYDRSQRLALAKRPPRHTRDPSQVRSKKAFKRVDPYNDRPLNASFHRPGHLYQGSLRRVLLWLFGTTAG
jgi:hypothetical protein